MKKDALAKTSAEKFSKLCDAVQTTHNGDPHMIVTGYSYGSLLSAYALNETTAPDGYTAFGPRDLGKEVIPTSTCFLGMFSSVAPEAIR